MTELAHSHTEPMEARQESRSEVSTGGNPIIGLARLERMLGVTYRALAFAEAHGFETYDVGDAKGTRIALWTFAKPTFFARLVRLAFYGGLYLAPIGFRKLLGVKPTRYPHASAMLACAYIGLSRMTGEAVWAHRARSLLEWLSQNTAQASAGQCWGSSFPWFTYGGATPTTVGHAHGTIWAANAFFSYHEETRDNWALEHCIRACDFLAYGLNSTEHASGSLSISYTALDKSQCINVNAESASILIRAGKAISRTEYNKIGTRIFRFVIEHQNQDGSWDYDVPVPGQPWSPNADGFHTGMVLSALVDMTALRHDLGDLAEECETALNKGLTFYLENLFTFDGKPIYAVGKLYPIDPYSCAQAIITLMDVCECDSIGLALRKKAETLLHAVVDQTLRLMLDSDGSFLTARYRFRVFRLKSLRWAQAVLCLAFVRYSHFLLSRTNGGCNRVESVCAEIEAGHRLG